MKKLVVVLLSTLLAVNTAYAAHPQCGKTELHDVMEDMKKSMGAIKKSMKADDGAKVTEQAKALLKQVEKAKNHVPLMISDAKTLTPEQQAEFNDYQKGIEFLAAKIESLIAASNNDERNDALKEIGKASKQGHKSFKMDCKK